MILQITEGIRMAHKLAYLTTILATAGLTACAAPSTTIMTQAGEKVSLNAEQTLQAFNWNLVNTVHADGHVSPAFSNQANAISRPFSLSFLEQGVSIQGLCNTMNAAYELQGQQIQFSQAMSTMKACPDEHLMAFEQQVGKQLPTATRWQLDTADQTLVNAPAPVLRIYFSNGEQWRLEGEATAETKYGIAPETVFLEVAAQTEICPTSQNDCLKVRSVQYDANGVKTGVGDWVLFQPNAIEGYTKEPNTSQIIRTKRYPIKNAPAGSATEAYILDMVVQSTVTN